MSELKKITAENGKVFKRIHDGFIFGNEIYLGIDYSTGQPRDDKEEYYEQVDELENNKLLNIINE